MDLNTLWFILIAVLYIGFFILEGFDYGVGILLPFLGKDDRQRRQIINTIGPFWDGNEVWLITAGGATFAAFPHWYATLFSGFYLALLLILLALILRGVAFEFRSKDESPLWRSLWDWAIFIGSAIPALLFGVAFGNLVRGVPIDANMHYVGTFFDLLNPYALVAGLASLAIFTLHGAIFLSLKADGEVRSAAEATARRLWFPSVVILAVLWIYTYFATDILERLGIDPGVIPLIGMIAMLETGYMLRRGWAGWAFVGTAISIAAAVITMFIILYPRVMISSLNPEWSLTIYNASSSPYTLRLMAMIAMIFVPIVLAYQAWTYWVFRHRVTRKQRLEY